MAIIIDHGGSSGGTYTKPFVPPKAPTPAPVLSTPVPPVKKEPVVADWVPQAPVDFSRQQPQQVQVGAQAPVSTAYAESLRAQYNLTPSVATVKLPSNNLPPATVSSVAPSVVRWPTPAVEPAIATPVAATDNQFRSTFGLGGPTTAAVAAATEAVFPTTNVATTTTPTATAPGISPNITAAVDPTAARSIVHNYITMAMRQGINLTSEQEQDFINNLTVAAGLDQPLELVDPYTNTLFTGYLEVNRGEIINDIHGMGRGVRPHVIASVIGDGAYDRGDLVNAVGSATAGKIGLTVDEIKFLYPRTRVGEMGYNWENTTSVMAADASQGYAQNTPTGTGSAPIFSGFYLAPNGLYYPVNTAALAPQPVIGTQQRYPAQPTPTPPGSDIVGQDTANRGTLGNLEQRNY